MTSLVEKIFGRVAGLLSVPDKAWARSRPGSWIETERFLGLLLHWGRYQLRLVADPAIGDASLFESAPAPERMAVALLSWRHTSPMADDWPASVLRTYQSLDRYERYRAMRILEHSRILEPLRSVDAIAAFASGSDDRANWPVVGGSLLSASSVNESGGAPVFAQRTEAASLVALAHLGVGAIVPAVERILEGWETASEGASSRDMMWSLGHMRIVDAVVFATVRAANAL